MPEAGPARHVDRAIRTYAAMQRRLYLDGARLYRERVPVQGSDNPFAYVWPFEEAARATLYLAGLPDVGGQFVADVAERGVGREAYWQPRRAAGLVRRPSYASYPPAPLGHGGDTYFDDTTWTALDLVQRYRMRERLGSSGAVAALDRARLLFDLVAAGWCRDRRPYPGGVYWVDAAWNRDRGAAVTAGLAVLALHLHELTAPETSRLIDAARRAYEWLRATLLIGAGDLADLYHDKVLGEGGHIDESQWIYNQGVAIAAGLMLHRVTGDPAYLEHARATAEAALRWYGARQYAGQPVIFAAIFFRNLLPLGAALDRLGAQPARELGRSVVRAPLAAGVLDRYRAAMGAYAEIAWEALGGPHLEDAAWGGSLLDLAGMIQIDGVLAWPAWQYALLA